MIIGLIEDSKLEFRRWEGLAEKSDADCIILWFSDPQSFLASNEPLDILIVDRTIEGKGEDIDIITSGLINDIKEKFKGPTVYSSECPLFKDERHLFDLALKGKKIRSIEALLEKLGMATK